MPGMWARLRAERRAAQIVAPSETHPVTSTAEPPPGKNVAKRRVSSGLQRTRNSRFCAVSANPPAAFGRQLPDLHQPACLPGRDSTLPNDRAPSADPFLTFRVQPFGDF